MTQKEFESPAVHRRQFLRNTGIGALTFTVAGTPALMTLREAHAAGADLTTLGADDAHVIEILADRILPGAAAAGVVHFIDHHLGVDPQECLLMCKYFPEIRPPFAEFYGGGAAALRESVTANYDATFDALNDEQTTAVIESLWSGTITPWNGPPPPLFYMMVRSDAVDTVYGTKEGFDALNIPYLEHIMPPEKW